MSTSSSRRPACAVLSIALALLAGCGPDDGCVTSRDCEVGLACINRSCIHGSSDDAGTPDAGAAVDAGPTEDAGLGPVDAGPVDTGAPLCAPECGDVDDDGAIDTDDAAAARALLTSTPSACELLSADVDRDGAVDQNDVWLVDLLVSRRVSDGCLSCGERLCGDFNDDAVVNTLDASGIIASAGARTGVVACAYLAGDVVRDGTLDRRDAFAVTRIREGAAVDPCEPCIAPAMCGDANRDGVVNSGDSTFIRNLAVDTAADVCERALSDLNADGQIDVRDQGIARDLSLGLSAPTARCPECGTLCGDVNQDGTLSSPDLSRLDAIRSATLVPVCERAAADVNGDGNVEHRDERLLTLHISGLLSAGSCRPCSGICGDLNGDGAVTVADRSVVTSIVTTPRIPTLCELDDGDVDYDGDVDADDSARISDLIVGTPVSMPCGR